MNHDRSIRRWWLPMAVVAHLLLVPPWGSAALGPQAIPPSRIGLHVDAGLLSLDVHDAGLIDVLTVIGERAGFEVTIAGRIEGHVTASFSGVPIPKALERLLRKIDHVVLYSSSGGEDGAGVVSQVWLLGMHSLPEDAPVEAAEDGPRAAKTHENPDKVRSEALLRLTREGATEEVLETLGDALRHDEASLVRTRAAMALGKLGDARAVPALQYALMDEHPSVQIQAIHALAQIDDEAAIRVLGGFLLHGDGQRQRMLVARALWQHGTELARAFLARAADDPDELVRKAAARPPLPARDDRPDPRTVQGQHRFERDQ